MRYCLRNRSELRNMTGKPSLIVLIKAEWNPRNCRLVTARESCTFMTAPQHGRMMKTGCKPASAGQKQAMGCRSLPSHSFSEVYRENMEENLFTLYFTEITSTWFIHLHVVLLKSSSRKLWIRRFSAKQSLREFRNYNISRNFNDVPRQSYFPFRGWQFGILFIQFLSFPRVFSKILSDELLTPQKYHSYNNSDFSENLIELGISSNLSVSQ